MSAKLHPFPPPTPEDATEDAPPPPPPLPASTDSTLVTNHPIETVRAVAVPILFNEHPLSMPIWVGGNAAAAAAYLFGLNPLNAASWTLLACVMKGFALSVVSPPKPAPTPLTPEQLAAYAAPAAAALNSARDLGARVFRCTDPRLALRAALCFYAATLVSSRCSTTSLCWGGPAMQAPEPWDQRSGGGSPPSHVRRAQASTWPSCSPPPSRLACCPRQRTRWRPRSACSSRTPGRSTCSRWLINPPAV